jgi:tetratricopeptide (TPR) repeat protein
VLLALAIGSLGCGAAIDRWRVDLRESERRTAEQNARDWFAFGDWERALASLERAQATPDLSRDFAVESTLRKAQALEKLGRREESLAHFRHLLDRHPDELPHDLVPRAALAPDRGERAAEQAVSTQDVDVSKPRFTKEARWAGVEGEVHVRCRFDARGRPVEIRVVGPAHPLLASFAIEAVAGARLREWDHDAAPSPSWDVRFQFDAGAGDA